MSKSKTSKLKRPCVYILTNKQNGTLYVGVTSHLEKRIWQHKTLTTPGFTSKYKINQLVYYETHNNVWEAIKREKNIKAWRRAWKLQLIEEKNPNWEDLYFMLM